MKNRVLINPQFLTSIADAIREKNGSSDTYKPAEMGEAILAIQSGGGSGESLPDWDDDSPIIARGIGISRDNLWELTEKGTLKWLVAKNTENNTAGFDSISITSILSYSKDFAQNAYKVKQVYVADGFKFVSVVALPNCERVRVPYGLERIATGQVGLKVIDFNGINTLRDSQCQNLLRLETVILNPLWTALTQNAFRSCVALHNINLENITVFNNYCLFETMALDSVMFNKNLVSIGTSAFQASGVTKVFFQNTADNLPSIANNAFIQCFQLKDIYVPWAEGEVANAPWGASNATIHYNTTYDENHNPIV